MKKYLIGLLSLLSYVSVMAQDFQGVAYYESKTSMDMDFGGREMTEEMKKTIAERMKSMFEKTFILTFNRTEASYLEEEKLETPGQGGFRMPSGFSTSGKYYKNIKEKRYTNQIEMFGKVFLIKDSLPEIKWELTGETKKIGNYTCFKATATKAVDPTDFRNMRPRRRPEDEDKDEADKEQKNDTIKRRSLLDEIETPKEVIVTAWYTPEIPVSTGPDEYSGLPGLILEISAGRTTILCSKIVLNPAEKQEISEASKGKKVTQAEYTEIMLKKMEEMRERFRNGGGRGGRGGRGGMF